MSTEEVDRAIDRYEVAVQRELMTMAHTIARLEMALGAARATLKVILPNIEGDCVRFCLSDAVARIERALAEKEI